MRYLEFLLGGCVSIILFVVFVYLSNKGFITGDTGLKMVVVSLMLIGSAWVYKANRSDDVSF